MLLVWLVLMVSWLLLFCVLGVGLVVLLVVGLFLVCWLWMIVICRLLLFMWVCLIVVVDVVRFIVLCILFMWYWLEIMLLMGCICVIGVLL